MDNQTPPAQTTQPVTPRDPKYDTPTSFLTPSHPAPKRLPKWLAALILLIIAIGISFGVFSALKNSKSKPTKDICPMMRCKYGCKDSKCTSPTPAPKVTSADSTANWKTYDSKRFKIKFSYPSKYVLVNEYEDNYPDQGFIHLYTQEGYEAVKAKLGVDGPSFIQLAAFSNPKKFSALEWAKSNTANSNFKGLYTTEIIAGENALAYTVEGLGVFNTKVLTHGEFVFTLVVNGDSEMTEDFKQILSTFKFIN